MIIGTFDGSRNLSDPWTGFTQCTFWKKKLLTDICGPVRINEETA